MFYSAQILARKGPLGIVWLAAHHDKGYLKKHQVFSTDVRHACDRIISPEAPLALRLSGQLMLGVVRIYYKQVVYLEGDAQGALANLNKSGGVVKAVDANVDLPKDSTLASEEQITLPDSLFDDPFASSTGLNFDIRGATPSGTPRGGTPRSNRRSSVMFLDEERSNHGSGLFLGGSQTFEMEMFEQADGLDLDREFAVAEPERARAAPEGGAPPGALLDLEADSTPAGRDEGDVPMPDELDILPPEPEAATPASAEPPRSPAATDASPGGPLRLPSLGPEEDGAGGSSERRTAGRKRGLDPDIAARQARRRQRVRIDSRPDGTLATSLPSSGISALLKDRTSLLTGVRGSGRQLSRPLPPDHVAVQSGAAANSGLFGTAISDALAVPLYDMWRGAYGTRDTGMPPPPPRLPQRPTTAEAEDAIAATPAEELETPMPDVMDYHFEADGAPTTGPEAQEAELPSPPRSASRSRRASLSGLLHPSRSGSVFGDEASDVDSSQAGKDREQVQNWLNAQFRACELADSPRATLAPGKGLLQGRSRRFAARAFFEVLSLQNRGEVQLRQGKPYSAIEVKPVAGSDSD